MLTGALTLGLLLPCAPSRAGPEDSAALEYQLKAAFLLNFARFVEWPSVSPNHRTGPIVICLAGGDPFGSVIDTTVAGKTVNGRSLQIRRLSRGDAPPGCAILFISGKDLADGKEFLRTVGDQPILTVGESPGFAASGGAIGFFLEDKKIRFEVNLAVVQQSGLTISSRLLNLARIVKPAAKP